MFDPDAPLRLSDAVRLAFPAGGMTVSGLRAEARAGRLIIEKRDGFYYTTLASIEKMREIAREEAARNVKPPPEPCVYVVGFGPYVKIGFTADHFERRLRGLNGGFPEKLEAYARICGATRADEKRLHNRFASSRLQGEWFRREGAVADWIEAGCPL